MPLNFEQKQAMVAELTALAGNAVSVAAAEYRGLTVSQMTALRVAARQQGVKLHVFRNTLARRAFQGTHFACLNEALTGPIVLLFAQDEPGAAARLLRDFGKTCDSLKVRGFALEGRFLGGENLQAVASMPSRAEALGLLAGTVQAPITKLVRTMNEPVAQFVRALAAVRDKKQAA
ncbi:MAG: 50S ribosomal protein L10 [Gammaproteobacteria bacterium RIFCSPHIGHO2_12_FULL_45_9]|nr:MAG: 50S ribosomal protein L10 [Gammaproteobacteria bacterium RIFCSPHIGHO2_12_FULL_45_9]